MNTYCSSTASRVLRRVVVEVGRRVPDATQLRGLEHVGKERRVQDAELFRRQELRQHGNVVDVRDHDPWIGRTHFEGRIARIRDGERANRIVHEVPGAHQDVERAPARGRAGRVGRELVGSVQHGPAVTEWHTRPSCWADSTARPRRIRGPASLTPCVPPAAPAPGRPARRTAAPCSKRTSCPSAEIRQSRRALRRWAERSPARGGRWRPPPDSAGPGPACRTSAPDRARVCSRCSARRERERPRWRKDHPGAPRPRAVRARSESLRARRSGWCR